MTDLVTKHTSSYSCNVPDPINKHSYMRMNLCFQSVKGWWTVETWKTSWFIKTKGLTVTESSPDQLSIIHLVLKLRCESCRPYWAAFREQGEGQRKVTASPTFNPLTWLMLKLLRCQFLWYLWLLFIHCWILNIHYSQYCYVLLSCND